MSHSDTGGRYGNFNFETGSYVEGNYYTFV